MPGSIRYLAVFSMIFWVTRSCSSEKSPPRTERGEEVRGSERGEGDREGEGGSYCRLTYLEVLLQQRDVSEVCEEESEEA
jgi:hypothetical protein